VVFSLRNVQLLPGVRVSGITWSLPRGSVDADVRGRGGGEVSELGIHGSLRRPYSNAIFQGQVDRRTLRATMLAP
jgi:hypothetical protein